MKSYVRAAWKLKAGAVLLAVLFASPVAGQAQTNTSSSRQSIELMVGQGRLLQLDEAAESVYVGDTTIADLRVVAPDVVYVYGRKIGSTEPDRDLRGAQGARQRGVSRGRRRRRRQQRGPRPSADNSHQAQAVRQSGGRERPHRLRRGSARRAERGGDLFSAGPAANQQQHHWRLATDQHPGTFCRGVAR